MRHGRLADIKVHPLVSVSWAGQVQFDKVFSDELHLGGNRCHQATLHSYGPDELLNHILSKKQAIVFLSLQRGLSECGGSRNLTPYPTPTKLQSEEPRFCCISICAFSFPFFPSDLYSADYTLTVRLPPSYPRCSPQDWLSDHDSRVSTISRVQSFELDGREQPVIRHSIARPQTRFEMLLRTS